MGEKLKQCPFCGSREEKPADHEEGCFIRMYVENLDEMCERNSRLHDRESMIGAWNTRAGCARVPSASRIQVITGCCYTKACELVDYMCGREKDHE